MAKTLFYRKDTEGKIYISFSGATPEFFNQAISILRYYHWRYDTTKKEWHSLGKTLDNLVLGQIIALENKTISYKAEPVPEKREVDLVYCWKGSIAELYSITKDQWLSEMYKNYLQTFASRMKGEDPRAIWSDCYDAMKQDLLRIDEHYPGFSIIFEFSIPETYDSRPDVLLVSKNFVIIVEYKNHKKFKDAQEEATIQSENYYLELYNCHLKSRESKIYSFVFYGQSDGITYISNTIYYCSRGLMYQSMDQLLRSDTKVIPCDVDEWINSPTEARPEILSAAKKIFDGENLKDINLTQSTKIPKALSCISEMIKYAERESLHLLVMVTGAPGAGKTYLGLQLVYDNLVTNGKQKAVYLSGNGPLVDVLQKELKNKGEIIKPVKEIRHEYLEHASRFDFDKNVVVFDEGQRAWDEKKMPSYGSSEPKTLIQMLSERTKWCVFIVLIGEGQQIHTGENGGISQWNEAVEYATNTLKADWEIYCPKKIKAFFPQAKPKDYLSLDISLRQIRFIKQKSQSAYSEDFVAALLSNDILTAKEQMKMLQDSKYHFYVTRDLEVAKNTVIEKCKKDKGKTYGFLISSKANYSYKNRPPFQVNVALSNSRNRKVDDPTFGDWYDATSEKSCRTLKSGVSEFGCQGLELDWPILYWGMDMIWSGEKWKLFDAGKNKDDEVNIYRINSYRVLLTRGRYGTVVYIPKLAALDDTFSVFQEIGAEII